MLLSELDRQLFLAINTRWTAAWLDRLSVALQNPWWLWFPVACLAGWLFVRNRENDRRFLLLLAVAVLLTDVYCAQILKPLLARPRPTVVLTGIRALVGWKHGNGLPSNHAANLVAATIVIGAYYRRWLAPMALVSLLVGYTRIYVGVHYPSDVLAGYAAGLFLAGSLLVFFPRIEAGWDRRRNEKNHPSGRVSNHI
ncbi:MAG: phosphatase PAP2 family protein [Myxococcales bacterium]|nr:phosphatase PAP2 family protein [Myxococcales bacterium]